MKKIEEASETFLNLLDRTNPDRGTRRFCFVPYDQLSDRLGPLEKMDPTLIGIILIENHMVLRLRPYHRQKIALLLANMRQFALEQARRGVYVEYLITESTYRVTLTKPFQDFGQILAMEPAEYHLRTELESLGIEGIIKLLPHEGWLTTEDDFWKSQSETPPWRMDSFYRSIRRKTGILMESGKPVGGKFSFDAENRKSWPGEPIAPKLCQFPIDPIKEEVGKIITSFYSQNPGVLDLGTVPSTLEDAQELWKWAKRECLENFGSYEDAMSSKSSNLFHTRISSLLNIHRILPREVIEDAIASDIPLNSKEGFIRQVLGWREFVRHVHFVTDGFRKTPGQSIPINVDIGDGGFQRWSGRKWVIPEYTQTFDGGTSPSEMGASNPVPPAFWGKKSGLNCLDTVITSVWEEGYSHHITRLMILSNLATLLDVYPRELTDWFWIAYTDAYDWVVEPNVLGMGTFALGNLFTTKPYISGAAYINKMSDYCTNCRFNPRKDCPITRLYWAFLKRHQDRLSNNPRLWPIMRSLEKRSIEKLEEDRLVFETVKSNLAFGEEVKPERF